MSALAGTGVLVRLIVRRDRWLLLWVALLALYPLLMVLAQESVNPTAADRVSYVAAIAGNSGFLMLYGPAYGPSLGALGIWAAGDALWIVALASVLTVIRHTRAEEETGRRELLGAAVVGRQAGLAAAAVVVLTANLALAPVAALALLAKGLPAGGAIALGLSLAGVGWVFAAAAAVAAQLTEGASAARGIGVALLGGAWLLRAAGDAGNGFSWLSWLSPLGWARRIRPFAGERWWILALFATVALFGLRPRLAAGGWAVLAVFLLLWVVEMSVKLSQPVLDVSPFSHIPKTPGEPMTAAPLAWLAAIAAALFVAGLAGFRRRDIEPA